ncbi:MAG: zinc ABC transporter substrate-binding protein, partial [Pseudomonadota bacterium]
MVLRPIAGIAAVIVLLLTAGVAIAQERPRIVATHYTLQYLAERIVGDTAQVVMPIPADVDPSFWRPSIADISEIQS